MKRLSIIALSAAFGLLPGLARVEAQDVPDVIERPDTPKCSFACALAGGAPSDPKSVAASAEPLRSEAVRDLPRHPRAAGGRKIALAKAVAARSARVRRVAIAAKVVPARPGPIVAAEAGPPVAGSAQTVAIVEPRPDEMTSPVVEIESARPVEADTVVQRRSADPAADDLHIDAGFASGGVEISRFTRYEPSWDWLITQAHAATVKRPNPYGDLDGARTAF